VRGSGWPAAALLARASARFYRRHPAQLGLSLLGIVLGTGIVIAVMITNASASRAFSLSTEALYGRSTHQLSGASGIDQRRYVELRLRHPDIAMAPLIEGNVALGDTVLTLVGVDPFAEAPFARFGTLPPPDDPDDAVAADEPPPPLVSADAVVMAEVTRARLALTMNEPVPITSPSGPATLRPVATFQADNPAAVDGLVIADIALAQELLDRGDTLDRIELILADDQREALVASLPETLRLSPSASRERSMQAMTRGFRINLTAMSLLALVVGAFLIHNTMTFAVLQRRELFATLRITGLTARQVLFSVLAEAALISLVGSVLGIALGRALAEALIRLTTRTINDLYFVLHVQEVSFGWPVALLGLGLGVGSSLLAATAAAVDAAATSPVAARQRSQVEERAGRLLVPLALAGLIAMLVGALLAVLPVASLLTGFAALMLLIVGFGLVIPLAVHRIARALQRPAARLGIMPALACGAVERNISRTGLSIAALAIAVSATFGVDVMIQSFRGTVDDWLDTTLASDVYVSSPSTVSASSQRLFEPELAALAADIPGVSSVSTGRTLDIATDVGTIEALVLEPHADSADGFVFVDGDPARGWTAWRDEGQILISEPLATKHALVPGDGLSLFTARRGEQRFEIAGVFRDYTTSNGKLLLSRATFDPFWGDARIGSLGLMLSPEADAAALIDTLRNDLASDALPLSVQSGVAIHAASLAVFDRTFEVTRVLRWLTVGVAFVGIFSALLALHLERAREFAVLRATGATQGQIGTLVLAQTALMGLLAGLLALPLGWITAQMLIHVINVRSFGWRMEAILPPQAAMATLILALASATLAGLWPAWRLARSGIARQLSDE